MITQRFTESYQFAAGLYPANKAAAAHNTAWLDMKDAHWAVFIIRVGAMSASATVDFKVQEATDSSGTDAQDISDKSITQLTQASGDANSTVVVLVDVDEMDVDDDMRYIRGVLTVGTDTVYADVIPLRGPMRFEPVSTTVLEEVVT